MGYMKQGICQNLNLKIQTKQGICKNFQAEDYTKQGICKNLAALSLYEVGYLWKFEFNSDTKQGIFEN